MEKMIRYGGRVELARAIWETGDDGEEEAELELFHSAPVNTLLTTRDGDRVFFGIARCNKKDTFSKKRGKEIARFRLDVALEEFKYETDGRGQSGLYGVTTNVGSLLDYFHNGLGNDFTNTLVEEEIGLEDIL